MNRQVANSGDVRERITSFIVREFCYGKSDSVEPETDLMEAGILDSTKFMEMVAYVEETFGIEVDDEDLTPENFGSIAGMVRFVEGKLS